MAPTDTKSNPGLAAVLSFIFNGLGQLYNGQIFKGLLLISLSTLSLILTVLGGVLIGYWLIAKSCRVDILVSGAILFGSGIIFICIIVIYRILDAYRVGRK